MIQGQTRIVAVPGVAEAINNLLDELDSSSRASIKATKPVNRRRRPRGRDQAAAGPSSVTYAKRWLSKPMTTLTIHKPRAEQLTGRDAHHRMRAILDETLDETLWAALRYQQGQSVAQAALGDSENPVRRPRRFCQRRGTGRRRRGRAVVAHQGTPTRVCDPGRAQERGEARAARHDRHADGRRRGNRARTHGHGGGR